MSSYRIFGLDVASPTEISAWRAFETPAAARADVTLAWSTSDVPETSFAEARVAIAGLAAYTVRDGAEIAVAVAPGADPIHVESYLVGAAWRMLCHQRGLFVMHASAVRVAGRAVAFCGASGMGKSSLAAWLVRRGYPLLGDDESRVEIVEDAVVLHPSASRLKLWTDSVDALGWDRAELHRCHRRFDKVIGPDAADVSCEPTPLAGIYVLAWGPLGMRRLYGAEALQRVLAAGTHHPGRIGSNARFQEHCAHGIAVLQRVPAWQLERPRDFAALDATVDALEQQWQAELAS